LIRDLVLNISISLSGYENVSMCREEDELIESTILLIREGEGDIKSVIEDAAVNWRAES
jgi:hypothetical protein